MPVLEAPLLEAKDLRKNYRQGTQTVTVLRGVSLSLNLGERVAIMGQSGSGKSTLLHLLGALDRPDSGTLALDGEAVHAMSDDSLSRLRRRKLGFIFQSFNLLAPLTARENVAWPLLLDGRDRRESLARAAELLEKVGLSHRVDHFPAQLSGGEMQRAAIARALVAKPRLILADEPTGNLDSASGSAILSLMNDTIRESGGTLLMVTHDPRAAETCDRIVHVRDGQIA